MCKKCVLESRKCGSSGQSTTVAGAGFRDTTPPCHGIPVLRFPRLEFNVQLLFSEMSCIQCWKVPVSSGCHLQRKHIIFWAFLQPYIGHLVSGQLDLMGPTVPIFRAEITLKIEKVCSSVTSFST
jgi:hypothetical protein